MTPTVFWLDDRVGHVLAREHVLDGLVFEQAATGLFDGQHRARSPCSWRAATEALRDDVVDLLLSEGSVLGEGALRSGDERIDGVDI